MDHGKYQALLAKLAGYATQTISEIWGPASNGCHPYSVGDLPAQTLGRLGLLNHDDELELYSLRVDGRFRVIGFLREHIYYILWLDPLHEVWPSKKKST
ncbi:MAG: hypothetical protein ACRC0L_07335 [Angustibacter sp.]